MKPWADKTTIHPYIGGSIAKTVEEAWGDEPRTQPLTEADIIQAQKAVDTTTNGHPIELMVETADRIDREDHLFR